MTDTMTTAEAKSALGRMLRDYKAMTHIQGILEAAEAAETGLAAAVARTVAAESNALSAEAQTEGARQQAVKDIARVRADAQAAVVEIRETAKAQASEELRLVAFESEVARLDLASAKQAAIDGESVVKGLVSKIEHREQTLLLLERDIEEAQVKLAGIRLAIRDAVKAATAE